VGIVDGGGVLKYMTHAGSKDAANKEKAVEEAVKLMENII